MNTAVARASENSCLPTNSLLFGRRAFHRCLSVKTTPIGSGRDDFPIIRRLRGIINPKDVDGARPRMFALTHCIQDLARFAYRLVNTSRLWTKTVAPTVAP